jgi:CheY-like chemotaxis protein
MPAESIRPHSDGHPDARLDGYAATKAIREQNSLNRDTIIIGLTAHADPLTRPTAWSPP